MPFPSPFPGPKLGVLVCSASGPVQAVYDLGTSVFTKVTCWKFQEGEAVGQLGTL